VTQAAAIAGALGVAVLVLASSRAPLLAGLALVLAALAGFALIGLPGADAMLTGGQADPAGALVDSPVGIAALAGAGLVVLAGAAALVRWPGATVPLLLALEGLRLPIAADPDSPVLLGIAGNGGLGRPYPFAAVLAAATLALAWRVLRGEQVRALPRVFAIPAAAFLALTVISFLWTQDENAAVDAIVFEWLPFAVVFVVAAHAPIREWTPRVLGWTIAGVACVLAAVGVWQAISGELFFYTAALERANEVRPIFRVTAAFQDPNYLGRYLVMGIGVVLAVAWMGRARLGPAIAAIALLGTGLWFTYSQSSLVALVIVALGLAVVASDRPVRRVAIATCTLLAVVAMAALGVGLASGSAEAFTSDRSTLATDTAAVAARHPVAGVGVAAQPAVTRDQEQPGTSKNENVSHTGPLTVAAELGIIGVLALVALILGAARMLVELGRSDRTLALGIAAVLATIFVHSLFYPGLFEQAMLWGALGVAAAAISQGHAADGPGRGRTALRS
jgi:hypothetical protein